MLTVPFWLTVVRRFPGVLPLVTSTCARPSLPRSSIVMELTLITAVSSTPSSLATSSISNFQFVVFICAFVILSFLLRLLPKISNIHTRFAFNDSKASLICEAKVSPH